MQPSPRLLLSLARRFSHDSQGGIAIFFALMLVALCLFVGAAVDLGRWVQARHQTIAAIDAAVLAGGRVLQFDDKDVTGARAAAQKFYDENTKGRTEVFDDTITFHAADEGKSFTAQGNAYIKTAFLGFANIPKLPLLTTAATQHSKAMLQSGKDNDPIEIAMMLDVTGSMAGTKIVDLKAAATDLVNIVLSDSPNAKPVRVAMVPFAEGVRLPSSMNTQARGTPPGTISIQGLLNWVLQSLTYRVTDCVVERKGAEKYTDAAPGTDTRVMALYNRTYSVFSAGVCGMSAKNEIVPLTKDKDLLKSRIAGLQLANGTAGQLGTAWTWYTLSPNWNVLWPGSAASAYGGKTQKIAILMTDGEYNVAYDTNGIQQGMPGAGAPVNGDSTTQARAICTNMKAKGITVYTVGFALGQNATAIGTLSHCATDPSMAYTPANGSELQQAFRDIALKLNQLYLTH